MTVGDADTFWHSQFFSTDTQWAFRQLWKKRTHSVMSGGLVKRTIPSALLSKPSTTASPHTTMLPETPARPVSMTILAFRTTSWLDPRQTLADPTLDNVGRPHIRMEESIRDSTQGEACPSQFEGVVVNQGTISWSIH